MIPPQPGGQHSPANLSYMQMAMQRNQTNQSVGYHIQNMKEEPNSGSANNYTNMGATQDDMTVSFGTGEVFFLQGCWLNSILSFPFFLEF